MLHACSPPLLVGFAHLLNSVACVIVLTPASLKTRKMNTTRMGVTMAVRTVLYVVKNMLSHSCASRLFCLHA